MISKLLRTQIMETSNWRWKHFSPKEIACKHCGELPTNLDYDLLDRLELFRSLIGNKALKISSGYRCRIHNLLVGGAVYSQHKNLAIDLLLGEHDLKVLYTSALQAGFLGLGLGLTFIHLDMRRPVDGHIVPHKLTHWFYGKESKEKWLSILSGQSSDLSSVQSEA